QGHHARGKKGVGGSWAHCLLGCRGSPHHRGCSSQAGLLFCLWPLLIGKEHCDRGPLPDKFTCMFTYASQGGTNEQWQMSLGTSEDHQHFTCTIWRPQGKSYLYFTQFQAEVRGAEIEYAMAYSKAAFERESDVPLKTEEFEVTKTAGGARSWPRAGWFWEVGSQQRTAGGPSLATPSGTARPAQGLGLQPDLWPLLRHCPLSLGPALEVVLLSPCAAPEHVGHLPTPGRRRARWP
uniref:Myeloid-derived growth factor n=1 Tax=Spermophilus dauricus TaxID=99837 RepID=A0A8C9PF22_SPEDA